jgi:thioredoxin reductase (NADPH)
MAKPAILAVDDDPEVSAAIVRDLRRRYSSSYRVVRATSGPEPLTVLSNLAQRDQPVALIVADQRMPHRHVATI